MKIQAAAIIRRSTGPLGTESLGGNAHSNIGTETGRGRLGRLIFVILEIQQLKSIGHIAAASLCGGGFPLGLDWERLLKWLSALVNIPINLAVLVFPVTISIIGRCKRKANYPQSAHHACSSKHCIVHRIGFDVAATTNEVYFDNGEVVDMIQVLSQGSFSESRIAASDDEVARGTYTNFAGNMARQDKLAVAPADVHLLDISNRMQL